MSSITTQGSASRRSTVNRQARGVPSGGSAIIAGSTRACVDHAPRQITAWQAGVTSSAQQPHVELTDAPPKRFITRDLRVPFMGTPCPIGERSGRGDPSSGRQSAEIIRVRMLGRVACALLLMGANS